MNSVIESNNLSLQYGNKKALKNISIQLHDNQLIGLIGKNGSGKTTFMKICSGILSPTEGDIKILNETPINNIHVLTEVVYSYPGVPHKENNKLEVILDYFKMFYPRFDLVFALNLLRVFSLSPSIKYKNLSQGMNSIFNFICAISTRAQLTLLDEPVIGMDVTVRKKVYEILLRDYLEHPRTILVSSHILSEMEEILSEIILLDEGNLVFYKDMDEIGTMAYRVDGDKEAVKSYISNRKVIHEEHKIIGSFAIIDDKLDEGKRREIQDSKLTVSKVRPEELYVFITNHGGETDLECLWKK